jgi:mono/diheme cytochrome c family protein
MKTTILKTAVIAALALSASSLLAADAKELWDKNCLKCHGADGKGQTKMGKQAGVKDYTDAKVQADMKDDAAIKAIKEGIVENGKKKMDPYKDKLSDDDVKALLAYVRAFKK